MYSAEVKLGDPINQDPELLWGDEGPFHAKAFGTSTTIESSLKTANAKGIEVQHGKKEHGDAANSGAAGGGLPGKTEVGSRARAYRAEARTSLSRMRVNRRVRKF